MQMPLDKSLFEPQMVVQAMRDSRYRHPANAIAELIDNSIDAKSDNVEVLIREGRTRVNNRTRTRVERIAVLDDGHGMASDTLLQALRFGGREETQSIRKIGKYGMGLPTASVSQCRRFDVWSWQKDINQAVHSYVDIDDINAGTMTTVPDPTGIPVPKEWIDLASSRSQYKDQGTLVVWSKPDRIGGKQASTIFRQLQEEIGRIYRHFIDVGELKIRLAAVQPSQFMPYIDEQVRPNDPLYLMANSSTPEPWDSIPMFNHYATKDFQVDIDGKQETIKVVYSVAKQEALGDYRTDRPGSTLYGKHARKNMGISVIRENREIVLENYFIRSGARGGGDSAPENRWWGCEVHFDRALDDEFGVDHNKQMVSRFSSAVKDMFDLDAGDSSALDELGEEDEVIYEVVNHIRNTTRTMLRDINLMFQQRLSPSPKSGGPQAPQDEAITLITQVTQEDISSGEIKRTATDIDRERLSGVERIEAEAQHLVEEGIEQEKAEEKAASLVEQEITYNFEHSDLPGYQMFKVVSRGGILNVQLNINHAIYEFIQVIEDEALQTGNETIRRAAIAIEVLILAWARMEDEIEMPDKRMEFQDTGINWGKMVYRVLNKNKSV